MLTLSSESPDSSEAMLIRFFQIRLTSRTLANMTFLPMYYLVTLTPFACGIRRALCSWYISCFMLLSTKYHMLESVSSLSGAAFIGWALLVFLKYGKSEAKKATT